MADSRDEKGLSGLETKKQPKPHWDSMDKEELVLQVKKQLMLLQKMKLKCDDFGSKNIGLEKLLREKDKCNEEIQMQLDSVLSQKQNDCSRISRLEDENANLNRKMKDLEEHLDCLTMKQETASTTFQCLQNEIKKIQDKNNVLMNEVTLLTAARDEALGSMKLLKETVVSESKKELDIVNNELALAQEEKAAIQENLNCLQKDFAKSEKLLTTAMSECETVEGKHSELQGKLVHLNQEYSSSKESITELENRLLECNILLENVTTEKDSLKKKLEDFETENEDIVLKTDSDSQTDTIIDEAKIELANLKQELQATRINGETLMQKIKDAELIAETFKSGNIELKTEYQKLNEKYTESLEKVQELNIALQLSGQREEEMSNKIEIFSAAMDGYNQMETQIEDLRNNEASLTRTIESQRADLEEILQFTLNLNGQQNDHLNGKTDKEDFCTNTNILNLLREYASSIENVNANNNAHERGMPDDDKTGLTDKLSNVEMQNTSTGHKIDRLQFVLESLEAKVAVLESIVPNEKVSVACQTETIEPPKSISNDVSTELLYGIVDADTDVSELIEKSTVECQTTSLPSLGLISSCVGTDLVETSVAEEQIPERKDASTEISQEHSIEMADACTETVKDEQVIERRDASTDASEEHLGDAIDMVDACTEPVNDEQIPVRKDASTETSYEHLGSAIDMVDACTEPAEELLPVINTEFCDGPIHETSELEESSEQKNALGSASDDSQHEENRNWTAEKEAYDAMLLDYARQLSHEKLSIEQSLRTILQCITETELDDNENSDINASLSRLKLLLDGISKSTSGAEDLGFSPETAQLYQISEVVSLFESVLLLKVQKWTTCFQTLNASLTGLEGQCNDLQKIVDEKEKSAKDAEELVNKYKSIAIKVKKEAAELKKKVTDVGAELDKTANECEHYKSQVERTSSQLAVLNKEKSAAEDAAKTFETQLNQEKEKHKQTLSRLEHALKEANQSNLMSLEFADYERLITDLNKQLELKNSDVSKLQKEAECLKEKIQGFQIQIEQLESQNEQSELRGQQLKNLSVKLKNEIGELRKLEGEWMATESSLMVRLESLSRNAENYKMQISDVAADNQKLQESKGYMQDVHQKAVRLLENRVASLMEELQKVKNEYTSCQEEYENYKVRAHSVLKHKTSKSIASDSGATTTGNTDDVNLEEKRRLEKAIEVLQGRVQELVAQLTVTRTELDTLQEEHDNLLHRHNNLALSQNELDTSWKQRVERLQKELLSERQEHASTVRNLQQQQQLNFNNSLKQQLDALRDEHKQQLEELQLKLDLSNDEIVRLQKEVTEVRMTSSAVLRDDDLMVDYLNTERQEGEGSEFTDNVFGTPQKMSTSGTIGFVPLDQLLNQDKFSNSSTGTAEIEKLENHLSVAAKRIEHLTEILNESEATNARMTEQTRVLKEEIRRLERNQEREQHLANMEYVKNIIVKFFSLPSGDERERLVPVLTTILRLSPDEEHQVQVIAKGGALDAQAAAGWSSYLPIWPRT